MKHVIRINVKGSGYSHYEQDEKSGAPVVVPPASLPKSLQAVVARLDDVLNGRPVNPIFSLSVDRETGRCIAAFGIWMTAPDEFDRPGMSLVHAVIGGHGDAVRIAASISTLLEPGHLAVLGRVAGDVALGDASVGAVFSAAASAFGEAYARFAGHRLKPTLSDSLLGPIEHDSSGAALAWLSKTIAEDWTESSDWSVYDTIGSNGRIVTRGTGDGSRSEVLLSQHLIDSARALNVQLVATGVVTERASRANPVVHPAGGPDPTGMATLRKDVMDDIYRSLWKSVGSIPETTLCADVDVEYFYDRYDAIPLISALGRFVVTRRNAVSVGSVQIGYLLVARRRGLSRLYRSERIEFLLLQSRLPRALNDELRRRFNLLGIAGNLDQR